MPVKLAGYNVDADQVELFERFLGEINILENDTAKISPDLYHQVVMAPMSPESLAAAYGRLAKSPKTPATLRRETWGSRARTREIAGNLHEAFPERFSRHVVFNFDLTNTSLWVLDFIENLYLSAFDRGKVPVSESAPAYIRPAEYKSGGILDEFVQLCENIHNCYLNVSANVFLPSANTDSLIGRAAEAELTALLPLAFRGHAGFTLRSDQVQYLLEILDSSVFHELNQVGVDIYRAILNAAPSLVQRYTFKPKMDSVKIKDKKPSISRRKRESLPPEVELICFPSGCDDLISVIIKHDLTESEARRWRTPYSGIITHSNKLKFGEFIFSITLSSYGFNDLKSSISLEALTGSPHPDLGIFQPALVSQVGGEGKFRQAIQSAEDLYFRLVGEDGKSEPKQGVYCLTQAHRRKVMIRLNLAQLLQLLSDSHNGNLGEEARLAAGEMIKLSISKCPEINTLLDRAELPHES